MRVQVSVRRTDICGAGEGSFRKPDTGGLENPMYLTFSRNIVMYPYFGGAVAQLV